MIREDKKEKSLAELVKRLERAYGAKLASVILYGSAAGGDSTAKFSDLNVLCVLSELGVDELAQADSIFRWWRDQGQPTPLLLSEHELRNSTDCFPIEFHDMKQQRRILYGKDLVADLEIDESFYRAQVEYQLRSKLLRLRQRGAALLHDPLLLLDLMADSVSTFCVLARHALRLYGIEPPWLKREAIRLAAEKFGIDPTPFMQLLDYRDDRIKPRALDPKALFRSYLTEIEKLVAVVDRLEK